VVFGATGFEHIEVFVFEIGITFFVDRVERVHEAIAEGIGVDVERRMDEVWDVGPECFIAFLEIKDRAEGFCLNPRASPCGLRASLHRRAFCGR